MKPPYETLYDLYHNQCLPYTTIGEMYGVTKTTARRWGRSYGIESRPSRGLANRGLQPPSADELYRLVHLEHMSYEQVAALHDVDTSTIGYWLTIYELPKPTTWDTRSNGQWKSHYTPDTSTLINLYIRKRLSTIRIAEQYGVGPALVRTWLIRRGIERRPSGWNNSRYACIDGHSVKSTYERRVDNWLSLHNVPHEYEPKLPFDRRYKADFLANGFYVEIWGVDAPVYNQRKARKIQLYKEHGLNLIQLHRDCFALRAKDRWSRKLSRILKGPAVSSLDQTPLPLHQTPASYSSDSCDHTS